MYFQLLRLSLWEARRFEWPGLSHHSLLVTDRLYEDSAWPESTGRDSVGKTCLTPVGKGK